MSEGFNVMERFMSKFDSVQRMVGELNSKRSLSQDTKEYINICKNVSGCVGEDYVVGLIQQKEYE